MSNYLAFGVPTPQRGVKKDQLEREDNAGDEEKDAAELEKDQADSCDQDEALIFCSFWALGVEDENLMKLSQTET